MTLTRVALSRRGLAYLTAAWVALLVIAQVAFNNDHTVSNIVWGIMFVVLVVLIVRAVATLVQFLRPRSH
jgi:peptidoglycan/LPS O-acetylase OafA/YrhL